MHNKYVEIWSELEDSSHNNLYLCVLFLRCEMNITKIYEVLYKEAKKAYKKNEIPVSAVIVYNNKIISKAHNNRQKTNSVLGHAEIKAIIKAEKKIKDWRLDNCKLYVSLFPCEMCQIIIKESRISEVYYILDNNNINEKCNVNIVQTNDCNEIKEKFNILIKKFFEKLRN